MAIYNKLLVTLDLTEESEKVAARARELAGEFGAEMMLLHVVEYVPVEPMGEALLPAVRIAELAKKLGLEHCERLVRTGNIKTDVIRLAEERGVDLIVMGSRERHGVSIMFNFTEDTVLHAAPCDVLAVRLSA
jgi:universal stress protein A